MKKTALVLIKDSEGLASIFSEAKIVTNGFDERMSFIKKQVMDLQEAANKHREEVWEKVEKELRQSDLLPKEYNKKKHFLEVDHDTGVLYWGSKDETDKTGILQLLEKLLT